jgi:methyl-accepting chemotaxis protein
MKLLAANLMITVVAVVLLFGPIRFQPNRLVDAMIIAVALGTGTLVNVYLVRIALRPIHSLTQVAWLVSQGLLGARVPSSITADSQLTQLSTTINGLLDDLVKERARISKLSGEPVATRLGVIRSAPAFQSSLSTLSR